MNFSGDLSLLERLRKGDGRIGALGLSGGNAGAEGCGQLCAFERCGLLNFPVIGGVSSFAGPMIYLASGDLSHGASCYWEECTTEHFINFSLERFLKGTSADVGYLKEAAFMRKTNAERILQFPSDLVVGVTDWNTRKGELLNLKTATPDLYAAVEATMAMPVLYRRPVLVNGRRMYDGAIGMPFPASELIEGWGLDGLIVFANRPQGMRERRRMKVVEAIAASGMMSPAHGWAQVTRHHRFDEGLRKLENGKTPYLILWTNGAIGTYTRDPSEIRTAAMNAQKEMEELLKISGA